jgi:hypothetical protein
MDAAELHEWVTFSDDDGNSWQFDVTFLTSKYGCIYGRGCQGVFTELAPEYEHGCCTYGAHFLDDDDRKSTMARIEQLGPDEWELRDRATEMGGPIHKNDDGEWVTQTVDDACIFLNRPDWKPQVCWQLPLRFDEWTDDNDHTTYMLREWKRRDWGEGGAEFAWWCTDDPLAFSEEFPVWRTLREEIVELVGQGQYEKLVDYVVHREATHPEAPVFLPHPQVRRRDENPLT